MGGPLSNLSYFLSYFFFQKYVFAGMMDHVVRASQCVCE